MRNLTKTIAAVSLLAPVCAYPLGVGDIKLHSALNQNLDAEIALLLSAGENVSDIRVNLAPPEKFDEAGVPWSYFLTKIKFDTVTRADGSVIVKLSSKEAFKEPFLDFLLEVNWAKGNLYREFTVLVDPPVAYTQPIIPVVEKAQQGNSSHSVVTTMPRESSSMTGVVVNEMVDTEYGPTRRSDNVWKIAERTNHYDDVSIEQMMMAIYKANPKAFYQDNVNALKAGQTLNIPEKEIILRLSKRQASAAFNQQYSEWKGRVSTNEPVQQTAVVDSSTSNTKLDLEAPVAAEISETVVVVAEQTTSADGIIDTENSIVESGTNSSGLSANEDNVALQAKYEKLEQQLLEMQDLLALKNQELAALQSSTTKPESGKKPIATTGQQVATSQVKPKPKPKPKLKPIVQLEPESDSMPLILGGAGVAILGLLGWVFWRKRKAEDELESESMFATASRISLPESSDLSVSVMDDASSYETGTVGESSFLSEFTPSDFDAFDTDQNEVDPISEADVYLAYGRYQQAEDLMRQAIEDQPERDECKLKLMEIFYANENVSAFEEYATELIDSGKRNDSNFWSKIVEMGAELTPESAIFAEDIGDRAVFEIETTDSDTEVEENLVENATEELETDATDIEELLEESDDSVEFDLSVFDENVAESVTEIKETTDNSDIDFDLSVFESDETTEGQTTSKGSDDSLESFDFPADGLSVDTGKADNEKTEEFDDFDFDFDADTKAASESDAESPFDIDLGVSDLTDMDELETKIDLAKAYVDMGDLDAAKSIADEVLDKGNEEQKAAAKAIIDQL